jgi:hypothetical protein
MIYPVEFSRTTAWKTVWESLWVTGWLTRRRGSRSRPFRLLWAYIRSEGRQPALSIDIVTSLINGLSTQYVIWRLQYMSVQANYLPHPLEDYLEK